MNTINCCVLSCQICNGFSRWSERHGVILLLHMASAVAGKSEMLFHLPVWCLSWSGCQTWDWSDLSLPGFPAQPAWAFSLQRGFKTVRFLTRSLNSRKKSRSCQACKGKCVTSSTFCWWKAHGKPSTHRGDYPRRCLLGHLGQGLSAQQSVLSIPSWEMRTLSPAAA